jgi:hypothetical protein
MQNWYALEVEAANRRQDWAREVAAEVRFAQARCRPGAAPPRWFARNPLATWLRTAAPRFITPATSRHAAPACSG